MMHAAAFYVMRIVRIFPFVQGKDGALHESYDETPGLAMRLLHHMPMSSWRATLTETREQGRGRKHSERTLEP